MTRPNSLPLLPPLRCAIILFFYFKLLFSASWFLGFLFSGSLLVFWRAKDLDLTLCHFSHFRGCKLAFGWFYYLLWACGSIRKQCKKLWQNAGITGGSLGSLGHKLGNFVCLCNRSKTVLNKCKNIGNQWMLILTFLAQTLGLARVQTVWKIPLKRHKASLWSECFLQQVHFFYKMVELGSASHWSRSCLSLLLCQKRTFLHMQCPFHNIFS